MPSRFRLSSLAVALALTGAAARAEGPAPAVVAAQLGAMPTSPGFRMSVNKGETGAPEATAVGARPIEAHGGHEAKAEPAKGEEKAEAKKGDEKKGEERKGDEKKSAEARPAKGAAEHAPEPKAATATAKADTTDPLERLRQRLAEKLGAKPTSSSSKFVMRVSNRGESGENVIAAAHPTASSLANVQRTTAGHAAKATSGAAAGDDAHAATSLLPTHWDYAGSGGPEAWGKLQPEYAKCSSGTRQSPIDIRGGIAVDLEPIKFDYRPSAFSVVDNGHTVQVNVEPGSAITITGRRYELVQFHFHRPSEERVDGRQFDMVVHLVHKDPDGRLAVVAVLLDRGSAQPVVQAVWNNLPLEKGDEVRAGVRIDLAQLLPEDRRYYTYMGSLTTPPCTEGVLWMVMKQPVPVAPEQVAIFARLYPMNARPIQQAAGRLIKESN